MKTRLFHTIVTVGLSLTSAACGGSTATPAGGADASFHDGATIADRSDGASTATDGASGDAPSAAGDAASTDGAAREDAGDAAACACGTCCPNDAGVPVYCPCEGGACYPCYV